MLLVLDCWMDLDSARYLGFAGAGPIPWPAIERWCGFHRIDHELTVLLLDTIRYLDVERSQRIASEHAHKTGE